MTLPIVRSFDLQLVAITLGSALFRGFASGDAMVAEFPADDFEMEQGSDGEVLWIRKHNNVADVTLRLAQGNPLIDQARVLHEASMAAGGIDYAFGAVNLRGSENITGAARIKKRFRIAFSDSAQPVEIQLGVAVSQWAGGFQL